MATKPSTRGTRLANIALLLGSTLATLLAVEIAIRAYARVQDYRVAQDSTIERRIERLLRLSPNDRIIYEFIPDISATFKGQRIHINAEGFRGVSRAFAKPCRTLRVLGIGDSVMFGWGIAEGETYLERLAMLLNADASAGYTWETINTAVPGYNTAMEVETLLRKGLAYAPDLVIVGYVSNDLALDLALPNFIRERENYFTLRKSFALAYLLPRYERLRRGMVQAAPSQDSDGFESNLSRVPPEYKELVGIEGFRRAMSTLVAASRERGFKVVAFTHSAFPESVRGVMSELRIPSVEGGPRVGAYMEKHGITDWRGSVLVVGTEDPHPSRVGHELAAETLHEFLGRRGIAQQIVAERARDSGCTIQ
jgi:hypothetical protein